MLEFVLPVVLVTLGAQAPPASQCAADSGTRTWQRELQCRKQLRIDAASGFFSADDLARHLLANADFQALGYQLIKHETFPRAPRPANAEWLEIRVTRKKFTTRFTVALEDPKNGRLFISEQANSIGGEIEPKLARLVMKWILEANGKAATAKAK